jgi:hypothetical protein
MNREMFTTKPPNSREIAPNRQRFEADMILNEGVAKQHHEAEQSKLIAGLRDENKSLKDKMNFVIEKDAEIYRLQCHNTLLQKESAEVKASTITDLSLQRDNERLLLEKADVELANETLRETLTKHETDILTLKQTIVTLAKAQSMQRDPVPSTSTGFVFVNVHSLKQTIASHNKLSYDSKLDDLLAKHRITDKQYVTKERLGRLVQEALH